MFLNKKLVNIGTDIPGIFKIKTKKRVAKIFWFVLYSHLLNFLISFGQEERTVRDRTLLQARESDHHISWRVKFNLGNSSRQITQCRNSIQGKTLLTDELGMKCTF